MKIFSGTFNPPSQFRLLLVICKYHGDEGDIASAIFYRTGDDDARERLEAIQASVRIK